VNCVAVEVFAEDVVWAYDDRWLLHFDKWLLKASEAVALIITPYSMGERGGGTDHHAMYDQRIHPQQLLVHESEYVQQLSVYSEVRTLHWQHLSFPLLPEPTKESYLTVNSSSTFRI